MASAKKPTSNALEIDRLALQLAKDPHSKVFLPLAEEYCKAGMWAEASVVLEDGLKYYPGFITAMVVLGRAYDQLGQATKAKAILEEAVKLSPENLRAHRTLVKIYMAQGLTDQALACCDIILGFNGRDEEALSLRAKLGKPIKQEAPKPAKKPLAPKPKPTEAENKPQPESAAEPTEPVDSKPLPEAAAEEPPATSSPMAEASRILESSLEATEPQAAPESPTGETAGAVSNHALVIAQLEAWLQSIERHRLDRAA